MRLRTFFSWCTDILYIFQDGEHVHKSHTQIVHGGNGKCVTIRMQQEVVGILELHIQNKINERHVSKGVLVPLIREGVRKRGGKRFLEITLSHATAEMLYLALQPMVKQSRRRIRLEFLLEKFTGLISALQFFHTRTHI